MFRYKLKSFHSQRTPEFNEKATLIQNQCLQEKRATTSVLNPNSNNLPTARRELVLSACQEISVVRSSLSLSARVHNEAPKIVAKKKTSGGVGTRISGDSSQTIELFRVPLLFVLSPDYQQESCMYTSRVYVLRPLQGARA